MMNFLCIQDLPSGYTYSYSALIGFDNVRADWDNWYWSNYPETFQIGDWVLCSNSSYYSGSFSYLDSDQLLCMSFDGNTGILENL